MEAGEGEYKGMWIRHHFFTLESQGNDTWICTGLSTGGAGGWGYYPCSLSDEEITEWLIQALKEDSDTIFLQILPVCNPQLIPRGYENIDIYLDFFNSIVDYAIGDYQLTRNLYIMKGAQLSDGAFSEQYSIALRMLYEYDFGSYAAALSFLDEEERENVEMLLEYAMSYNE